MGRTILTRPARNAAQGCFGGFGMAVKRIIVKTRERTRYFKWWSSDHEIKEDQAGRIGKAKSLEDAVTLAKQHTGGTGPEVTIRDA